MYKISAQSPSVVLNGKLCLFKERLCSKGPIKVREVWSNIVPLEQIFGQTCYCWCGSGSVFAFFASLCISHYGSIIEILGRREISCLLSYNEAALTTFSLWDGSRLTDKI